VLVYGGASITFVGAKTTVLDNCTLGTSDYMYFGLHVYGSLSTIQLISPLTKERVAIGNGGGGNWGAANGTNGGNINQIKTIVNRSNKTFDHSSKSFFKIVHFH
jgi:hypothetical protein